MEESIRESLSSLAGDSVKFDCDLKKYTSFGIGGPADAVVAVSSRNVLQDLLVWLENRDIPWHVLGRGTNLLVSDSGYPGVVLILTDKFCRIASNVAGDGTVFVQAGCAVSLAKLGSWCCDKSLSGMEFAMAIPGSLGGAVVMNAGAHGNEFSDIICEVHVAGIKGEKVWQRQQMSFVYRHWNDYDQICGKGVLTQVTVRLRSGSQAAIKEQCHKYLQKRKASQPKGVLSGGSFFKNPPGFSAGQLIDKSGLKGTEIGGAGVSQVHANFLINKGDATAADMLSLMRTVQKTVQADSGVMLEPEVEFLGLD